MIDYEMHSDRYDPEEELRTLRRDLVDCLGGPVYRMARFELDAFLEECVARALRRAFSKAEALCVNDQIKMQNGYSRTILEAVLAGGELAKRQGEDGE